MYVVWGFCILESLVDFIWLKEFKEKVKNIVKVYRTFGRYKRNMVYCYF